MSAVEFLIRRDDLRSTRFESAPGADDIELKPDQVLLAVDKFGFSANNITYAAFGDVMRYWDFFPGPEGWGRLPVWGFANVVRSNVDAIQEGERLFGYLPLSTHLVVQPDKIRDSGFVDAIEHRTDLPGVYQRYGRVSRDPDHDPDREDQQALWQPLFMTSFGAADFLGYKDLYGAKNVVISSASSKTALGVAFLLSQQRPGDCEIIGLTSAHNREFCEGLGYYDKILSYEQIDSLPQRPTIYVDLAGNEALPPKLRSHLAENLKKIVIIGITNWDKTSADGGLGAEDSTFFFLPSWLEQRRKELGPGEFGKMYGEAQRSFFPSVDSWMRIERSSGEEAVEAVYLAMLEGKVDPQVGHILSLR
jgi:Protein of unknown function (DUF2855)